MGSNVVISAQTGEANQKFYFDQTTKTIKTAAQANRSLDIASNGGSTNLQVGVTSNVWWQNFRFQGERFVNCQSGKAIEIQRDGDGQNVYIQHKPRGGLTQKFLIKYVDNTKVDRKYSKGELNKEYGLKVGIPFSIYTRMRCQFAIDIKEDKLVVKRKNGQKSQNFIFNDDTRTITSLEFPEQSFGIQSSGKNRHL